MSILGIKGSKFRIIVKPSSRENKLEGFDIERNAYKICINAKPEGNKANVEFVN